MPKSAPLMAELTVSAAEMDLKPNDSSVAVKLPVPSVSVASAGKRAFGSLLLKLIVPS